MRAKSDFWRSCIYREFTGDLQAIGKIAFSASAAAKHSASSALDRARRAGETPAIFRGLGDRQQADHLHVGHGSQRPWLESSASPVEGRNAKRPADGQRPGAISRIPFRQYG
jgi:hypothetical protein